MSYVTEIASGTTVLDVADKELLALKIADNANKALVVNSSGNGYTTYNLGQKVDIAQGSANAGKALVVDSSGNVAVSALKTINNNSIVGEGNIQGGHTWTTTPASGGIGGASSTTPAVVVENYCNGTEWYRVWSDGWIEQGGRITNLSTATYDATITLPKAFSNTNYTIVVGLIGGTSAWQEGMYGVWHTAWNRTTTQFHIGRWNTQAIQTNYYATGY